MNGLLKSFRNYSLMLCLPFILVSCTTAQNIVVPNNPETSPGEELPVALPSEPSGEPPSVPFVEPHQLSALNVDVNFSFWDCDCKGIFQRADIILNILNGETPFNINGQEPVNERLVTFPVAPGISFPLTIISFNNMIYEAKIEVPFPSSCQPPKDSCGEGSGNEGSGCTDKGVQVCEDQVTTIDVCVKWTGNGNKCLEWEKQEQVNTVCRMEIRCE